jgi:hypothetical protein
MLYHDDGPSPLNGHYEPIVTHQLQWSQNQFNSTMTTTNSSFNKNTEQFLHDRQEQPSSSNIVQQQKQIRWLPNHEKTIGGVKNFISICHNENGHCNEIGHNENDKNYDVIGDNKIQNDMEIICQKENLEFQSQKGMISKNEGESEGQGQREDEGDSESSSTNGYDSEVQDLNIDKTRHLYSQSILDT